ncbi:hypothetical protein NEMIN01_2400 [Nematocida minor]|uniref:uncharacterized protein n=1 Tax=Nematocida minor TaxID=1912983 RepID=UPI00221F868E|nr:uncharacterized protein NEMIN01_2400 [Nematocida minor]KAI5193072.1 hypothetical protein NEMIN01_2400 [Nematocida minor]
MPIKCDKGTNHITREKFSALNTPVIKTVVRRMKEVKLSIDIRGMLQACLTFKSTDKILKYNTSNCYADILSHLFDNNIKIDSENSNLKNNVLAIIRNRTYQHIMVNQNAREIMSKLHTALKAGDKDIARSECISLANELVKPNTLIYSPEYGIHRQPGKNGVLENIAQADGINDLSSRTYTLQIDDTKSSGLEGLVESTKENMDEDFLSHTIDLIELKKEDTNILKKYAQTQEKYNLEELYNSEDNNTALVDSGLSFISEKYADIIDLIEKLKHMETVPSTRPEVIREFKKVFTTEEDLKIFFSIVDNIQEIKIEKTSYRSMISNIKYIGHKTELLGAANEPKVLKINSNLSNFDKDYISRSGGLKQKVYQEIARIDAEISSQESARAQIIGEEKSDEEAEKLKPSINNIENEICSLQYDRKKEELQISNIRENLYNLRYTTPAQRNYMLEKLKDFGNKWGMHVEVEQVAEESKLTKTKNILIYIGMGIFLTLSILFVVRSRGEINLASNN